MSGLKLTALRYLGVVKETTYGIAPTTGFKWLPVKTPTPEQTIKYIADQGLRGIAAKNFGQYQGVQATTFKYELDVYQTDFPLLFTMMLGPDTKTGTTNPYTHTFNLAAAEPASMTLEDYDGIDQFQITGARPDTLDFKFDAEGNLSCSLAGTGFPPVSVGTSSPSYAAEAFFLGWKGTVSIGGGPNTNLVSGGITFKRKLTPRYAVNNSSSPSFIFVDALDVTAKLTFDIQDDTEFTYFTANTQPSVVITFTDPTTSNALKFQMSKFAFTKAPKVSSKEWLELDASGDAVYNATDSGPVTVVATNGQSAAY